LPSQRSASERRMTVVTLSRQLGAHGEEIAAGVAQLQGLRLVDAQTINRAAQRAGVPHIALAEMEHEGERSLVGQVLKALRTMPNLRGSPAQATSAYGATPAGYYDLPGVTIPFSSLFSPTVPPISASLESYVRMVGLVIRELAREGNVLIVGRGGQALLSTCPEALHVQVVAPLSQRIKALMARGELSWRAAQSKVRASDRARFDYVRRYHDEDWLDPTLYHLVINTGLVSVATAIELIVVAQRAQVPPGKGDAASEQKE
jgi:hypothetical protein